MSDRVTGRTFGGPLHMQKGQVGSSYNGIYHSELPPFTPGEFSKHMNDTETYTITVTRHHYRPMPFCVQAFTSNKNAVEKYIWAFIHEDYKMTLEDLSVAQHDLMASPWMYYPMPPHWWTEYGQRSPQEKRRASLEAMQHFNIPYYGPLIWDELYGVPIPNQKMLFVDNVEHMPALSETLMEEAGL